MSVIYSAAMSLDGFIAPVDGSADWLSPYLGSVDFDAFLARIGGLVVGRASFEQARATHEWDWGGRPSAVMTQRPISVPPGGVEAFSDPHKALAWLAPQTNGGDVWLFGGGITAGQFLAAGLIETIELAVIPVLLGTGRRLFDGVDAAALKLAHSAPAPVGVMLLTYRVAAS